MPMQLPIASISVFRAMLALREKINGANMILKRARIHVVSSLIYEKEMDKKKTISIVKNAMFRYFVTCVFLRVAKPMPANEVFFKEKCSRRYFHKPI